VIEGIAHLKQLASIRQRWDTKMERKMNKTKSDGVALALLEWQLMAGDIKR
jgi:hypothetical protein